MERVINLRFIGFVVISISLFQLMGCASSYVSRDAADRVDSAYALSDTIVRDHILDAEPISGYRNSSQIYQGAAVGAVTGGTIAGLSTGTIGIAPGAIGGAVVGGVIGAFVEHHSNEFDRIENRGGQVIVLGEQILIVLPSSTIFRGVTANIQPRAYPTLNLLARLISGYHSMSVNVAAHSFGDGTPTVECALTQDQANAIVRYLSRNSDTRLLHGVGMGGAHLVDKMGAQANYRIEITLENLPV